MNIVYPKTDIVQGAKKIKFWRNTKAPVFEVHSTHALNQIIGYVKFINGTNGTVLYRGQTEDFGSLYPGAYRPKSKVFPKSIIQDLLGDSALLNYCNLNDSTINGWEKYQSLIIESTLQHYGAATNCMDFVDNHWCALWFGVNEFNNNMWVQRKDLDKYMYLYLYLADTNGPCIRGMYIGETTFTVDLRKALPSQIIRPAAQHGWIVRNKSEAKRNFGNEVVCVVKIKVSDAIDWLGTGRLVSVDNFFPPYSIDEGYRILLERQVGSGVSTRKENRQIFPKDTITNYHLEDTIYCDDKRLLETLIPQLTKATCFQNFSMFISCLLDNWSKTTCNPNLKSKWSETNPFFGQSKATAILINEIFGGNVMYFGNPKNIHYYNDINGVIIDFTAQEVEEDAYQEKLVTGKKLSFNKIKQHKMATECTELKKLIL